MDSGPERAPDPTCDLDDLTGVPEAPPQAPDLKALPLVGLEVIRLAFDARSDAAAIERVVATDVSLTQRLLRVANSALYHRTYPATTVREAVVHLGMTELRRIVFTTSVLDFMSKGLARGFDRLGFFLHSLGTASLAQELSDALGFEDPPIAFVSGLLHDVGKTYFDQHYPEPFSKALRLAREEGIPLFEAERQIFPDAVHPRFGDHAAMGAWAIRAWNLPDTLLQVAARHHERPTPSLPFLVRIVQCADSLAHNLSLGSSGNGCAPEWSWEFDDLGLDGEELAEVVTEGLQTFARMTEIAGAPVDATAGVDAFRATLLAGRMDEDFPDDGDVRIGHG